MKASAVIPVPIRPLRQRAAVIDGAIGPMDTGTRSVGDAPEDNGSGGADIAETARAAQVIDALISVARGGPGGIRTPGLLNAIEARSQLRHRPTLGTSRRARLSMGAG